MGAPIVLVHGWSADSGGMRELGIFLRERLSADVSIIDLADWLSLNDEVTYRDLSVAMDRAWRAQPNLASAKEVNVVTHSTGALVVRDWMTSHFKNPKECPVKRLLMLAPANFGSPLAHKGDSFLARAFKGWNSGFQTGTNILSGLELASSYTWDLAQRDVWASQAWYGKSGILATVLVGNDGYPGLQGVVNEFGSDGTVRVSTANLNAAMASLEFREDGTAKYEIAPVPKEREVAFRVIRGLNHGSITKPPAGDSEHGRLILDALTVQPSGYEKWRTTLAAQTEAVYAELGSDENDHPYHHAYQNTVVRAYDDVGNPVEEYLVEFYEKRRRTFSLLDIGFLFQQSIIYDVHNFRASSALRSFYIDVTLLRRQSIRADLCMNVSPQPTVSDTQPVGYSDVESLGLDEQALAEMFQPNRTLLLDVKFPRQMRRERVFDIKLMQ